MQKIKKAIIPAAGLGTRMLPITKAIPKEMLPILDRPAIDYIIEEAVTAGIEQILIITSHDKSSIENYYDRHYLLEKTLLEKEAFQALQTIQKIADINLHFLRQKEPRGLGHAVWCARHFVGDEPFAVLLPDDIIQAKQPCLLQMLQQYERFQTPVLAVQHVVQKQIEQYGIINYNERLGKQFFITDVVEKPKAIHAPSNLAVVGRYILTASIFSILEKMVNELSDEIQLTAAISEHLDVEPYIGYLFNGERYDIGNKVNYVETILHFALNNETYRTQLHPYLNEHLQQYQEKQEIN